ncbi:MAG: DNA polymerase III subunit gamma/tau [Gemmatimonadales bacterium]
MALALARKYRPRRFSDLLVQDHVAQVLRGAVVKNRVGHGYLLTGPRGVGKTTAARILAMALNCERKVEVEPAGEPCGACDSCQRIWTGVANLDVVEIDAASNRGVDDARELRERAMYAASKEGHHKVYIVDEAHMLTREAWNALLKILEEPPPGVVFVFATTEPQKIAQSAAPVLSRLQRFDFRRIGAGAIRDRLRGVLEAEHIEADEDALTLIARQADGGMRDALSVLDQCLSFGEGRVTALRVREILGLVADDAYGELLGLLVARQPAGVFALLDRLEDAGADLIEFMGGAGDALRSLLMLELGAKPEGLTEALHHTLEGLRGQLAVGDLVRMLKLLGDAEAGIRRSASPRLSVETLLLRWALLDRTVDLEAVLGGAGRPEPPAAGSAPGRPPEARPAVAPAPAAPRRPSLETPAPPAAASAPPAPAPAMVRAEFSLEGLVRAWPDLVAVARAQGRFLGEAMASARPAAAEAPMVTLTVPDGNPIHVEGLERQRDAVQALLSEALGAPVHLGITAGGPGPGSSPRARRLSESESRAERLRVLKGRDPALEAAADSLDLEVLE